MAKKKKPIQFEDSHGLDSPLEDLPSLMDPLDQESTPISEPEPEVPVVVVGLKPEKLEDLKFSRPKGVAFKVFALVGGFKADQLAGFENYAKRHKLGPMGIKAWREEYQAFLRLPA